MHPTTELSSRYSNTTGSESDSEGPPNPTPTKPPETLEGETRNTAQGAEPSEQGTRAGPNEQRDEESDSQAPTVNRETPVPPEEGPKDGTTLSTVKGDTYENTTEDPGYWARFNPTDTGTSPGT